MNLKLGHRTRFYKARDALYLDHGSDLKREEIYANDYRDLEHLSERIEEFIERYYNRCRLHSALGYRSPDEFENQSEPQEGDPASKAATIRARTY